MEGIKYMEVIENCLSSISLKDDFKKGEYMYDSSIYQDILEDVSNISDTIEAANAILFFVNLCKRHKDLNVSQKDRELWQSNKRYIEEYPDFKVDEKEILSLIDIYICNNIRTVTINNTNLSESECKTLCSEFTGRKYNGIRHIKCPYKYFELFEFSGLNCVEKIELNVDSNETIDLDSIINRLDKLNYLVRSRNIRKSEVVDIYIDLTKPDKQGNNIIDMKTITLGNIRVLSQSPNKVTNNEFILKIRN